MKISTTLILFILFSNVYASRLIIWQCVSSQINVQSDSITPFDSSFTFELGGFLFPDGSTTPTEENRSQWIDSWEVLDTTSYNATNARYTDVFNLTSNTSPFEIGNQAYIWGFKGNKFDQDSEWILFTKSDWVWPNGSGPPGPPGSQLQWILNTTDTGFTAVAGELNSSGNLMRSESAFPNGPTYTSWLLGNFSETEISAGLITDVDDDPDLDGIANILEYATGSDPRVISAPSFLRAEKSIQLNQNSVRLKITRVPVAESLIWDVQSNLNIDTNFQDLSPQPAPMVDTATELVYELPIQISTPKEFYRIKVGLMP